jgi:hypothetical protein
LDQAIRGELLDPSHSIEGSTFKTAGDLISVIGHGKPVYVYATYCGRNRRQERPDRSQQVSECYRFRDIGIASALQAFLFILWRCKSGYGNDRDGFGLLIMLKQTRHFEPTDVRQSNIHQD